MTTDDVRLSDRPPVVVLAARQLWVGFVIGTAIWAVVAVAVLVSPQVAGALLLGLLWGAAVTARAWWRVR